MTQLRSDLPPLPQRMRKLPIDERGYPVPSFVDYVNGKPDFRTMNGGHFRRAIKFDRCWLCAEPLGRVRCFLIGPMCAVNRTTSEPPSHADCAIFAVKACPFLSHPMARRNTHGLPDEVEDVPGVHLDRNPGATAQWFVERTGYSLFDGGGTRPLLKIAEPVHVDWWREKRPATRAEIITSIESGLPALRALCENEGDRAALERQLANAMKYLPAPTGA
jgi:hypothetical protein